MRTALQFSSRAANGSLRVARFRQQGSVLGARCSFSSKEDGKQATSQSQASAATAATAAATTAEAANAADASTAKAAAAPSIPISDAELEERTKNMLIAKKWSEANALDTFIQQKFILENKAKSFTGLVDAVEKQLDGFRKSQKDGVIPADNVFTAIRSYVMLENPILKKYKFEPTDFLEGASAALSEVRSALCSRSFYDYANNLNEEKPSSGKGDSGNSGTASQAAAAGTQVDDSTAEFLKSTLHPRLYSKCVEAIREMHNSGPGFAHLPQAIDVQRASIVDIDVRVVTAAETKAVQEDNDAFVDCAAEEDELLQQHNAMMAAIKAEIATEIAAGGASGSDSNSSSSSSSGSEAEVGVDSKANSNSADFASLEGELLQNATKSESQAADAQSMSPEEEVKAKLKESLTIFHPQFKDINGTVLQMPSFPEGSIVVDVKVNFVFLPLATDADKLAMEKQAGKISIDLKNASAMEWVFSGCLSNHAELEYKISSFGLN